MTEANSRQEQQEPQPPEPTLWEALGLFRQLSPDRRRAVLRRIRQMPRRTVPRPGRLVSRALGTLKRLVTKTNRPYPTPSRGWDKGVLYCGCRTNVL
jgi:hypothetical protein